LIDGRKAKTNIEKAKDKAC